MVWMARSQPGGASGAAWDAHQPDEPDDAMLVAAAQADRRAFGPLYDRYARLIYRYCYTRLGTHEAAEDATAEVFTRALAALDRYYHRPTYQPADHLRLVAARLCRANSAAH